MQKKKPLRGFGICSELTEMEELELPPTVKSEPSSDLFATPFDSIDEYDCDTEVSASNDACGGAYEDFDLGILEERFRQLEEELEAVHKKKQKADVKVARAGSTFCTVVYP